ncbi:MAG: hypothetical protein Q8P18_19325 [Pseudomonadota bacterium]|nr:hypothetical protein [Pseudomonadota bacterium]
MGLRVQILGATRLARVVVPYLLERRAVRVVGLDPGEEDESLPWFAPVRGLARANGIAIGRVPADIVLDLDPDARPTRGEGPMLRVLAPPGARSPDVNRALLEGGAWGVALVTPDGGGSWARRSLDVPEGADAEALLDYATTRAVEALDEGWEALVAGAPAVPLERPLIAGRFRPQEAYVLWAHPAARIAARVRGCAGPWGGARAQVGDNAVYLLDARVVSDVTPEGFDAGTIVRLDDGVELATGRGVVRIERLRPGWRPPRAAGAYLREVGLSEGYQLL